MSVEKLNVLNDNVIGRLYNIIGLLKDKEAKSSQEVFCKVFSIEKSDRASIMTNYAELYKMCIQGSNEIERLQPKNLLKYKSILNDTIDGISKIYFNGTAGTNSNGLEEFIRYFNGEMMRSLENCADYLSENSNDTNIEDEKVLELIQDINELIEYILGCKLEKELEKILIYQLNNVRESLLKYKLYGSQGVISSLSTTLGTLILSQEEINKNADAVISVQKIFQVVGKINTIISFKTNSLNLISAIYKKLTGNE